MNLCVTHTNCSASNYDESNRTMSNIECDLLNLCKYSISTSNLNRYLLSATYELSSRTI